MSVTNVQVENLNLSQVLSVIEFWLTLYVIDFKSFGFYDFFPKDLGEGCDPRGRMRRSSQVLNLECNGGLICYQKSDKPWDGICVPKCRNGRYIDYKKILWYKENPKKPYGTMFRDDQFF